LDENTSQVNVTSAYRLLKNHTDTTIWKFGR
jgi:hypothetical protein